MTDICLLVAAERSGTHLLRSLLSGTPGIKAPGEIANAAAGSIRTESTSYLKFRKERCLDDPGFFFATRDVQTRLIDEYLDRVRRIFGDQKFVVLDVKYSHMHNFNAGWWDPSTRPFLIEYARTHNVKIIHLVRTKVYRTAISQLYTQESGTYRARDPADVNEVRVEIPRTRLERKAQAIAQTIAMFERWISQNDHLRVNYETLTSNSAAQLAALKDFLSLEDDIPPQPKFVKTTPPYEQAISNFPDISDLVDVTLWQLRQRLERQAT